MEFIRITTQLPPKLHRDYLDINDLATNNILELTLCQADIFLKPNEYLPVIPVCRQMTKSATMQRCHRLSRYTGLVLVSSLVVGCAGGLGNDASVTTLSSEPSLAACSLRGTGYAMTVTTPAHLTLPKEAAPVRVSCSKVGHKTFLTDVKPLFNEKILNNFLLLSTVGMLVDMIGGHESKYPEKIHLNLEPTIFSDADARDRWFGRYKAHITLKWDRIVSEVSDFCVAGSGEDGDCMANVRAAEVARTKALERVELRRKGARVKNSNTAQRPPAAQ